MDQFFKSFCNNSILNLKERCSLCFLLLVSCAVGETQLPLMGSDSSTIHVKDTEKNIKNIAILSGCHLWLVPNADYSGGFLPFLCVLTLLSVPGLWQISY